MVELVFKNNLEAAGAWIALNKQGQDMIKSSNKRIKLLEVGDNGYPSPPLTGPLSARPA